MIRKETFHLPSSNGRSKLHGVLWRPEGEVRMVLQISHGMIEHMGYYEAFASWLAEHGVAVAGHDHLGHGQTVSGPEEFGFFGEKEGYRFLIKDLHRVRTCLESRFPGIPYFLMGHSMGSFMVRRYLTAFGDGLTGAILMGTGNQPGYQVWAGLVVAQVCSAALGADYRSRLAQSLFRRVMNQRCLPTRTAMDWLSTDEEQVDRYMEDPACSFLFTCSGYRDLLRMVSDSESARLKKRIPAGLPLLFISGTEDPVGGYGKGVRRAYAAYQKAGLKKTELILYPGCRHELVIEKNRLQAAEDIYHWMKGAAENSRKDKAVLP